MVKPEFTAAVFLFAALLFLTLPLKWLAAAVLSIALHEGCHILALRAVGQPVCRFRFGILGAALETAELPPWKELICTLAGPASCVIALLLARWLPRVAVCSLFHSAYNLLPVGDLDGGRAVRCLAGMLLPPKTADRICLVLEKLAILGIIAAGFYGTFCLSLGIMPICITGLLLIRKTPCKDRQVRLQ